MTKGRWTEDIEEFSVGGFEQIQPGKYLFQVEEGITLHKNESGSMSYQFPMTAVETKDEECEESIGRKISFFQNVVKRDGSVNEFGEKIVIRFLSTAGVVQHMAGKFTDEDEFTSDYIVDELARILPGRLVLGTVGMGKDQNGNERAEITAMRKYPKQAPYVDKKKGAAKAKPVAKAEDPDEDWG